METNELPPDESAFDEWLVGPGQHIPDDDPPAAEPDDMATPFERRRALFMALKGAMQEADAVAKTGWNQDRGYAFVRESDVIRLCRPALLKHDIVPLYDILHTSQPDVYGNTLIRGRLTLTHVHTLEAVSLEFYASGNDAAMTGNGQLVCGDKGVYKALAGLVKYSLLATFMLAKDVEPEVQSALDRQVSVSVPEVQRPPSPDRKTGPSAVPASEMIGKFWTRFSEDPVPQGADAMEIAEVFISFVNSAPDADTLRQYWANNRDFLSFLKSRDENMYGQVLALVKELGEALKTRERG